MVQTSSTRSSWSLEIGFASPYKVDKPGRQISWVLNKSRGKFRVRGERPRKLNICKNFFDYLLGKKRDLQVREMQVTENSITLPSSFSLRLAEKKIFEYERSHMNHKMYRYYCTSHIDPESVFTPTTREVCCQRPDNRSDVAFEAIPSPFALCCPARGGSDCGGTGGPARGRLFTVYHSVSAPPLDQVSMHCSHLTCCLSQLSRLVQSPLEAMGKSGSCHFFHTIACILHFLSILILCIFVIQLAVKVICMGRAFFRLKFEVSSPSCHCLACVTLWLRGWRGISVVY